MKEYISARYIKEKSVFSRSLFEIIEGDRDSDNIAKDLSPMMIKGIVEEFAIIAKELGAEIPEV